MTSTEIKTVEPEPELVLVNPETGEALAPTVENAAIVLDAARDVEARLRTLKAAATEVVVEASRSRGTKTFDLADGRKLALSGGPRIDYDPEALADLLREAGCPEDRIDAVVKPTVTYKVDRSVLRSLTGANEDYRAAAALAERSVEEPWRAYPKERR